MKQSLGHVYLRPNILPNFPGPTFIPEARVVYFIFVGTYLQWTMKCTYKLSQPCCRRISRVQLQWQGEEPFPLLGIPVFSSASLQSHYTEFAQGCVSSGAIHKSFWIFHSLVWAKKNEEKIKKNPYIYERYNATF